MVGRRWFQPPRRVLTSFLVVVVACVGALAWLGYRLLDQDRALESQRIQEQLEIAGDLTAASLERKLAEFEKALDGPPSDARLPDGTILIVAGANSFGLYGNRRLLFYPEADTATALGEDAPPNPQVNTPRNAEANTSRSAYEFRARPDTSSGQRVSLVNAQPVLAIWHATAASIATAAHFRATVAGPQHLTSLEFKLLTAFIRNRGRVLNRQRLLDEAWGPGTFITDRVVDNHIVLLRKKIEPEPHTPRHLVNIRGLGYRFDG